MHKVEVTLKDHSYPILIERNLLARVGQLVTELSRSKKVGIVTDSMVGPLYANRVVQALEECGIDPVVVTLPAGEQYKHIHSLLPAYDAFLESRFERSTPIIALGGGVVGDMTGFVAATLLRGVPFIQIPTTLLSMVDASVGGKTGIDHAMGKNLIGAFHQPIAVLIDPETLTTLSPTELRSGLAECIKHDCIRDADGFAWLESHVEKLLDVDLDLLTQLIAHNVAIKARVVEADPFERAERAHLNFGHTFGHAIETVANYTIPHGFCVALGMIAAAYVSQQEGLISPEIAQRIERLIHRAELLPKKLSLDTHAILQAMHSDKKVQAGAIRFVLLDKLGHAIVRNDIPPQLVRQAVESLRG